MEYDSLLFLMNDRAGRFIALVNTVIAISDLFSHLRTGAAVTQGVEVATPELVDLLLPEMTAPSYRALAAMARRLSAAATAVPKERLQFYFCGGPVASLEEMK